MCEVPTHNISTGNVVCYRHRASQFGCVQGLDPMKIFRECWRHNRHFRIILNANSNGCWSRHSWLNNCFSYDLDLWPRTPQNIQVNSTPVVNLSIKFGEAIVIYINFHRKLFTRWNKWRDNSRHNLSTQHHKAGHPSKHGHIGHEKKVKILGSGYSNIPRPWNSTEHIFLEFLIIAHVQMWWKNCK